MYDHQGGGRELSSKAGSGWWGLIWSTRSIAYWSASLSSFLPYSYILLIFDTNQPYDRDKDSGTSFDFTQWGEIHLAFDMDLDETSVAVPYAIGRALGKTYKK